MEIKKKESKKEPITIMDQISINSLKIEIQKLQIKVNEIFNENIIKSHDNIILNQKIEQLQNYLVAADSEKLDEGEEVTATSATSVKEL